MDLLYFIDFHLFSWIFISIVSSFIIPSDNWQKFCLANGGVVKFLVTVSYQLDEGVAPLLLQLLQAAICSSGSGKTERSGQTVGLPDKRFGCVCVCVCVLQLALFPRFREFHQISCGKI